MHRQRRLAAIGVVAVLVLATVVMKAVSATRTGNGAGRQGATAGTAPGAAAGPSKALPAVRIATIGLGDISRTREVSGSIAALNEVVLSSKLLAPVRTVTVREGDPVRRGQLIVQLDPTDFQSQMRQQEAAVRSAEARLAQAQANLRLAQDQTRSGIRVAEQALVSAQARAAITRKGARRQERSVAANAVEAARSALESAQAGVERARADQDLAATNLRRQQALYRQGAVAQAAVDSAVQQKKVADAAVSVAEAQVRGAQRQLSSAQQQLSLVEEGARSEEIEAAESAVRTAEANLQLAKENRQNVEAKREDVRSAQAAVAQARAALDYARQQLALTSIVSPIDGFVSQRNVEPGQTAGVGAPLISIVNLGTVYFAATVSETELKDVSMGKPVSVIVDAMAGREYPGSVTRIMPSGDPQSRTFTVRVSVPNPSGELKPGMFARGTVQVARILGVTVVPKDALAVAGSEIPMVNGTVKDSPGKVFVYSGGQVRLRNLTLGAPGLDTVEVRQGLNVGEQVVVSGTGLQEGDKVRVAD